MAISDQLIWIVVFAIVRHPGNSTEYAASEADKAVREFHKRF